MMFRGVLILLAMLSFAAEAAAPKRVLIIHSFGRDFGPFNAVAPALIMNASLAGLL